MNDLFVKPERFWDEWRQGRRRLLLFTDPNPSAGHRSGLCQPCYGVSRGGDRLILTNLPPP